MINLWTDFDPLKGTMFQIMDETGVITRPDLVPPELRTDALTTMLKDALKKMIFMKLADQKANNLQRQGRMGTYASIRGQEAIQTATGMLMTREDWLVPAFRELGVMWLFGIPLKDIYQYWVGNEWGSHAPANVNCLPIAIPVGSQMLHAVGIGMGMKMRKEKKAAVTFFGDGATSEGDFHEAMNCAGVYGAQTVFICQNNQWAISVPRSKQTASKTIAQKAIAYGVPGIQVDGNDLIGCYVAVKAAIERARNGEGATLIEAHTFRLGDHTTSDDAKKYRDPKEVETWLPRDPLVRIQAYLAAQGVWNAADEKATTDAAQQEIERAVADIEQTTYNKDDIYKFITAEPSSRLKEQMQQMQKE